MICSIWFAISLTDVFILTIVFFVLISLSNVVGDIWVEICLEDNLVLGNSMILGNSGLGIFANFVNSVVVKPFPLRKEIYWKTLQKSAK